MKSCFNAVFVSAVFLILWAPEGFSKQCHVCWSYVSWDDCLKNSKRFDCKERHDGIPVENQACITVVRSKLLESNQQENLFAKYCTVKERCDREKCQKEMLSRNEYNKTKAAYCNLTCCYEDLCNVGKLPEETGERELSKAEVSLSSCFHVMSLAFIGFILGNN